MTALQEYVARPDSNYNWEHCPQFDQQGWGYKVMSDSRRRQHESRGSMTSGETEMRITVSTRLVLTLFLSFSLFAVCVGG